MDEFGANDSSHEDLDNTLDDDVEEESDHDHLDNDSPSAGLQRLID